RPYHDDVDVARQHARRIANGFAAAELHLIRSQHDHIAAELAHRDFKRHARAGRRPLENHRQRLAGERPLVAGALGLYGARQIDHPAYFLSRYVDQIEEMTNRRHCAAVSLVALSCARESRAQARSSRAMPSAISCSLMISGGSSRTTLSPAATAIIF